MPIKHKMQCECCLEPCYAKDMAELSCHHIAHKVCINILMADPVYSKRSCPVKRHCDGVNLLNSRPNSQLNTKLNIKISETKEQIVARLRARVETINSLSTYSPDNRTVEYYAALMIYQRLNARLQPDEHLISCKNNKVRYLRCAKVDDIFTVTVYVDKVVQCSLKFGEPYREILPQLHYTDKDFVVANSRDICLLVKNGVIYPYHGHINHDIKFTDYDNKVNVTIATDERYANIADHHSYRYGDKMGKDNILMKAKQLLCDQHYAEWLDEYQYELKNLECTIDRLDYH